MERGNDVLYATLAAGESYASVADLNAIDDIAQATIEVPRWRSLKLLLRGLDLEQQERILDQARRIDSLTGKVVKDRKRFCTATLREICILPRLTDAQAQALGEKNASILEAITTFAWNELNYSTPDEIAAIVRALADLPPEPADIGDILDQLSPDDSDEPSPEPTESGDRSGNLGL